MRPSRMLIWLTRVALLTALVTASGGALAQARRPPVAEPPSRGPDLRAWANPKARDLAREGIAAKRAGDPQLCVTKDQSSLALEDHPAVRLHLAGCLAATGKIVDALKASQLALSVALRDGNEELREAAEASVSELLPKVAHVRFKLPPDANDVRVRFDGVPVRPALLRQRIAVDPGEHLVEASRSEKGEETTFREELSLAEGADKTVEVLLRPNSLPKGQRECLETARSYEEKLGCIEEKKTKPNVRIGLETSAYTDSTNVHVFTPAINAAVSSPTAGWNIGGSYLLDIVTAASPEIVSMASGRYRESRHAGSLSGGYKVNTVQVQANGNVSREPDYLSMTGGGALSTELNDKLVTPRVGYSFTYDRIGIRSTPFDNFERNLSTHELEIGSTFVLSPTTLLVTGVTVQLERGEQSKLYRYVPVFDPEVAQTIQPGASYEEVNAKRLDARPREVVPRSRNRYALGARVNHRLGNATIRAEERLYRDDWGITASTTDLRYLHDLSERLRVWPHLRLHVQSEASFYQLAYPAVARDETPFLTLKYRTGDRELSRFFTITAGGGARYELSADKSTVKYAVILSGEVMYSRYLRSLFITSRTAIYGTLGFEVEL